MTGAATKGTGTDGTLWLFGYDVDAPGVKQRVQSPDAPTDAEIAGLLGLPDLPPYRAEVIALADIADLGLRGYLIEAHDVLPEAVGDAFAWLDTLRGHVLIVEPGLAATQPLDLQSPHPALRPIGRFAQGSPAPAALALPAAERPEILGSAAAPRPAQKSGAAAVLIILALMVLAALALFGVPIWPR